MRAMETGRRLLIGGAVMGVREIIALVMSAIGAFLVMRFLGPRNYGVVTVILAVSLPLGRVGTLGLDAYLIRFPGQVPQDVVRSVAGLLYASGVLAGILLFVLAGPVSAGMGVTEAGPALAASAPMLTLGLASRLPIALLERELRFKEVAHAELVGMLVYHAAAIPLAFWGLRYWAVVTGSAMQALTSTALLVRAARPPAPKIEGRVALRALRYGLAFQLSQGLWLSREMIGPAVLGRTLGPAAVGALGATRLIVQRAAFPQTVMWRVGFPGMAHLDPDGGRRAAIERGMTLQALVLGSVLLMVGWIAPWLLSAVAGPAWRQSGQLLPLLAAGAFMNGLFVLHASLLMAEAAFLRLNGFHVVNIALLIGASLALVPRLGLIGYGMAEVVCVASYAILLLLTRRWAPRLRYGRPLTMASLFLAALVFLSWQDDVLYRSAVALLSLLLATGLGWAEVRKSLKLIRQPLSAS